MPFLQDILTDPRWAIREEAIPQMMGVLTQNIQGFQEGGTPKPIEVTSSFMNFNMDGLGDDTKKAAVIKVHGPMSKNRMWSTIQYDQIRSVVQAHLDDPEVASIIMDFHSPGGTVAGLEDFVSFMRKADNQKPVYAWTDGMMASAAMWAGSTARVIGTTTTSDIGSIGVLMVHMDASKMLEDWGLKLTFLHAGKFKAYGNMAEPLEGEAKQYLQAMLDDSYEKFKAGMVDNRPNLAKKKATTWAEGQVFAGDEAKEKGLVDFVGTRDEFFAAITSGEIDDYMVREPSTDLEEAITTDQAKEETNMAFDPKKFEGDPEFQAYLEGVQKQAEAKGSDSAKAEFESELEAKDKTLAEKDAELQAATTVQTELSGRVAAMEKREAIRAEADLKATMVAIVETSISASSLSGRLVGKAKAHMLTDAFTASHIKDGVLDTESFTTAVHEEVADWESSVEDNAPVLGGGGAPREVAATDDTESDATAKRLARHVGHGTSEDTIQ